jgi:hypothetical protein
MLFMEPASLVMERKMLLGIKQRAERLAARGRAHEPADRDASVVCSAGFSPSTRN